MKIPKTTKRFCPFCKKRTNQKIKLLSGGHKRGSLKRGGIVRAKLRGRGRGIGNVGKWGSKPAVGKFKRKIKTTTKKVFIYTCDVCKKSKNSKKGIRVSKVVQE